MVVAFEIFNLFYDFFKLRFKKNFSKISRQILRV